MTMGTGVYLLFIFGPFFLLPAALLIPATLLTLRRVRDPLLLLTVAIFTGLAAALCLAESTFRGYWIEVESAELKVECASLIVVAVVVGAVAIRRLGKRVLMAAAVLIGVLVLVALVLIASGLDRTVAANVLRDSQVWYGSDPQAQQWYADHVRADVLAILTPTLGIALFWPAWYLANGRPRTSRPFRNSLAIGLVGLAPIGLLTWIVLPAFASRDFLPPLLLHEAFVLLTWWLAVAVGVRSAGAPWRLSTGDVATPH